MNKLFLIAIGAVLLNTLPALAQDEAKKQKKQKKTMSLLNKEFTTESGLVYKIIHEGAGQRAKAGDMVLVHYTGKLTNDTVFDSSYNRNQPFKFKLGGGQVIKGWDEGIALLNVGDKAIFTIPPALGYGERNMGQIPSNSTLIFEVELLSIVEKPKPFNVQGKDTITTETGLKYIKINETKGEQPTAGSTVFVHYTGYLTNGSVFDSSVERGQPFSFPIGQGRVIPGWDEGIAKLKVGEKAQLIVPHNLGYGERGFPPVIPENATLIFDVELVEIKAAESHQHHPGDGHNH
ncbi:MAG: FKBP-type peptidyl-prolyl cis-trans isomerase [Bacteroidota bacterium]|nr:FKBP-type peptidyl-prolyl cis-trans isomerase [Bacteroidota bacterium]